MARSQGIWRQMAPVEHGAWAFLALPVFAALGHRHTAGAWVAALLICLAFLAKRPMERLHRGGGAAVAWCLLALIFADLAALFAFGGLSVLPALALQATLGLGAWLLQQRTGPRSLATEVVGSTALLAGSATILVAGGAALAPSLRFAGLLASLALPPLLLLRRQVARSSGRPSKDPQWLPGLAALAGLGVTLVAWRAGAACPYLPLWSALTALRALPLPAPRKAKSLGYAEALLQLGHLGAALWALSPV